MRGVAVGPVDGLPGELWMTLFNGCHSVQQDGITRQAWPDGGCLLEQEQFTVETFQLIENEVIKIMTEKRKSARARK